MRKHKTRLLKSHRPRTQTIKHLNETVYKSFPEEIEPAEPVVDAKDEFELEPHLIHKEHYRIRPLFTDEAIMDLEMSERSFIVFHNAKTDLLSVLYRRPDGDYGLIEPNA